MDSIVRREAVSFSSIPMHVEYNTVLLRPPLNLGTDLHRKPFKIEVWLGIPAAVILTAVILSVTSLVHDWNVRTFSRRDRVYANWIGVVQKECWIACSAVLLQCE